MPEGCGNNRPPRNAPLDPAITKEPAAAEVFRRDGAPQDNEDAASKALVEGAPGDFELGPGPREEANPKLGTFRLSQEVERLIGPFGRHGTFDYTPTKGAALRWSKFPARIDLALTGVFLTG